MAVFGDDKFYENRRGQITIGGTVFREHRFVHVRLQTGEEGSGEIVAIGPLYMVIALERPVETSEPDSVRTTLKGKWMYVRITDIAEIRKIGLWWPTTDDKYKNLLTTRVSRNFKSKNPVIFAET